MQKDYRNSPQKGFNLNLKVESYKTFTIYNLQQR